MLRCCLRRHAYVTCYVTLLAEADSAARDREYDDYREIRDRHAT